MASALLSPRDVLLLCAVSAVAAISAGCDVAAPPSSAAEGSGGITTAPLPDEGTGGASDDAGDPGMDSGMDDAAPDPGGDGHNTDDDPSSPNDTLGSSSGADDEPPSFPDMGDGVPDLDPHAPACPEARAQIMLVLDKSASMEIHRWDHDLDEHTPQVTRWQTLYEAVGDAADLFDGVADVGVLLFPAIDAQRGGTAAEACAMDDQPNLSLGSNTAGEIVGALPTVDVDGGTPTTRAMLSAVEELDTADLERPRAIVLVTDGAANCGLDGNGWLSSYDPRAIDVVADAWDQGIPTFVVGVDILDEPDQYSGKNVRDAINELAEVGGMPAPGEDAFYNVRDGLGLADALEEISGAILCPTPEG